uniref:Uncharacterized protein n=1 Tax=Clytia hemisphaerica TaxID=252671 RepID=A0A7M5V8Y6_9CNID
MAASNPKEYGFDVKFVEKLDRDNIKCAICFMVLREPLQGSTCGHRYCKKCIEDFHEKNPKKCPQDWQDNEWFKDLGKEREILDLKIRCKNHRDGCTWQNELRDQEEHLKTCDFETIQCNLRCGEPVLRKNLQNHLDKDCPLISTCEYSDFGCLFKGTRDQLYNHMSQAINQHFSLEMKHEIRNVKKEFSDKLQEKDLRIQEITKEFDAQLKERDDEIKRLRKDVEDAKKDFQRASNEINENHKAIDETKKDFTRVIDETKIDQQKAIEETKKDFIGVVNETKIEQQKGIEETKKDFTRVIDETKIEQQTAIEETKKDVTQVVNQTKVEQQKVIEETKKDFTRVVNETKNEQQKILNESMENLSARLDATDKNTHEFINSALRERSDHVHNLNKKLAEENKLTLQILSLPQCPYYSFTIENFKTQFEEAKKNNKIISSQNFLTANGYLGLLEIYLNGYGSGKDNHVSVYFRILKGPYDNSLKWPIPWKSFSITLLVNNREIGKELHQSSSDGGIWKDHFIRPIGDEVIWVRFSGKQMESPGNESGRLDVSFN